MSLRIESLLVLVLAVSACSGGQAQPIETVPPGEGAASPREAVTELVEAIQLPDFTDASRLAMPGHSALAALAEGATFADVAEALRDGDEEVAANFWAGFAQGSGDFLVGGVSVSEEGTVSKDEVEFHEVIVVPESGESRSVLVRESDGYRIDLFASFGPGLADKMIGPVERLLTTQTDDASLILEHLREVVPSLLIAAERPGTSTEVNQRLLALIEVITRVG